MNAARSCGLLPFETTDDPLPSCLVYGPTRTVPPARSAQFAWPGGIFTHVGEREGSFFILPAPLRLLYRPGMGFDPHALFWLTSPGGRMW